MASDSSHMQEKRKQREAKINVIDHKAIFCFSVRYLAKY